MYLRSAFCFLPKTPKSKTLQLRRRSSRSQCSYAEIGSVQRRLGPADENYECILSVSPPTKKMKKKKKSKVCTVIILCDILHLLVRFFSSVESKRLTICWKSAEEPTFPIRNGSFLTTRCFRRFCNRDKKVKQSPLPGWLPVIVIRFHAAPKQTDPPPPPPESSFTVTSSDMCNMSEIPDAKGAIWPEK